MIDEILATSDDGQACIALRQMILRGQDVNTSTGQCIRNGRKDRCEGLALSIRQLDEVAARKCERRMELIGPRLETQGPASGLEHQGEAAHPRGISICRPIGGRRHFLR